MKRLFTVLILLLTCHSITYAAADSTQKNVVWAFPITSYIVPLKPGVQVVQVKLPSNIKFVKDKQIGLLRGVASGTNIDTSTKGWGRCHLVKGEYNYFSINMDSAAKKPKAGDLIYTHIPRSAVGELSYLFYCAANNITFKNVRDTPFFKPADFLKKRSKPQDDAVVKLMVEDIRTTGKFFIGQDTSKNLTIAEGSYKGSKLLNVMMEAGEKDLTPFLQFVAARPRRYAGNSWKLSETFATWVLYGAPVVIE